jgi:hypothetical protein
MASQRNPFYAVDEVANAIASHFNILPENCEGYSLSTLSLILFVLFGNVN